MPFRLRDFLFSNRSRIFVAICMSFLYKQHKVFLSEETRKILARKKRPQKKVDERDDEKQVLSRTLDELGIFKQPFYIQLYLALSTTVHVVNFFAVIFYTFHKPTKSLDMNCFLVRLVFHESIPQKVFIWLGWILSAYHLTWRCFVSHSFAGALGPTIKYTLIPFATSELSLLEQATELKTKPTKCSIELLTREIYLKVSGDNQVAYVMRPNRTIKSRRKFDQIVTVWFRTGFASFFVFVSLGSVGLRTLLLKQSIIFAGCSDAKSDYTTLIYWYRFFGSTLLGFCQAVDSFVLFLVASFTLFATSSDMLVYWRDIHKRLVALRDKILLSQHVQTELQRAFLSLKQATAAKQAAFLQCDTFHTNSFRVARKTKQEILIESRELRASLADFFACLRQADIYVSTLMGLFLSVWLSSTATASFLGLQSATTPIPIRIAAFLFFNLIAFICYMPLQVKRATEQTYPILCALIALDSFENMEQWRRILEYFATRRYAFTLFGGKVFTQITFLKIISYTFTIIVVLETLFNKNSFE